MGEHVSVLVVGAGLSGIGAAYRLQTECPSRTFLILEAREELGGTWDLFRYPGIRSDSDMFTLGYPFRPWQGDRAIGSGAEILDYLRETAAEFGIGERIRYGQRVTAAAWSTATGRWVVTTAGGDEFSCEFLYLCTGYYRYDSGYEVTFPGQDSFAGTVVHPQKWPSDLEWHGRDVVVIGSGATAVTLVPALAADAAHVTMVQRSPGYLVTVSRRANVPRRLPSGLARRVVRWRFLVAYWVLYQAARRFPGRTAKGLIDGVSRRLPAGVPVRPHFVPRYRPWDQRLGVVPGGDLFRALRDGRASVETGTVETFTERGVRLAGGTEVPADIVVTATGLSLVAFGGIRLAVDGEAVEPGKLVVHRGAMFGGVPNLAWCLGYTNASWTLRADLTSRYVCRLLNHMERRGYMVVTPRAPGGVADGGRPLVGLDAGYVRRAAANLPRQGRRGVWRMRNNYLLDLPAMTLGRLTGRGLTYARKAGG